MTTTLITLPRVHRQAGTYSLPAVQMPTAAAWLEIAVGRDNLPAGDVATAYMEWSADGVQWIVIGGIRLAGGVVLGKSGAELAETVYHIDYPFAAGSRVRGTVVLHQAASAAVTVRMG